MTSAIIASFLLIVVFALGWLLGAIAMWSYMKRKYTRQQAWTPSPHREPPERSKGPHEYQHIDWMKLAQEQGRRVDER